MTCKIYKIDAPAGTGKTEFLVNKAQAAFKKENHVAFVTFTRRASAEFRSRLNIKEKDKETSFHVGTLNSIAWRELGFTKEQKTEHKDQQEFCSRYGLTWKPIIENDYFEFTKTVNKDSSDWEKFLSLKDLWFHSLKNKGKVLEKTRELEFHQEIIYLIECYENWLLEKQKSDYVYSLYQFLKIIPSEIEFDYCFADETQDFTPLMWKILEEMIKKTKYETYFAGDKNQAIFEWAGADPYLFENAYADETITLTTQYRMPAVINEYCAKILTRIQDQRFHLKTQALKQGGLITKEKDIETAIENLEWKNFSTLIVCPTNKMCRKIAEILTRKGIAFYGNSSPYSLEFMDKVKFMVKYNEKQFSEMTRREIYYGIKELKAKLFIERGGKTRLEQEYHNPEKSIHALEYLKHSRPQTIILDDFLELTELQIEAFENGKFNWLEIEQENIVVLSTIHKAKGTEKQIVIYWREFPHKMNEANPDYLCRLDYVACSRSNNRLVIVDDNLSPLP